MCVYTNISISIAPGSRHDLVFNQLAVDRRCGQRQIGPSVAFEIGKVFSKKLFLITELTIVSIVSRTDYRKYR